MSARERYLKALHAMQSGVAMKMNHDPGETTPKHLRVGVNAAMSDQAALVKLLIDKGVITEAEYIEAVADKMEEEAKSYESYLSKKFGKEIKLG